MAQILMEQSAASVQNPPAGKDALFIDSADSRLKRKDPAGIVHTIENPVGAVTSVYGRTGDVVAVSGDYDASEVTNTPAGGIVATNVQAAINELDGDKLDTSHQGAGGAVHAVATTLAAGFMSPTDKSKLDGVATGATAVALATATPQPVGTPNPGSASDASKSDHVHAHGNQGGGTEHLAATILAAGFMSAADKIKSDGLATVATSALASDLTNVPAGGISATNVQAAINELDSEKVPSSHIGSGGAQHADATTSVSGFLSGADKTKLDGLATVASTGAYSDLSGTPSSLPPSGSASGELSGSYPSPTLVNSAVIGKVLTGFAASFGVVTATDTILQAIQKLAGTPSIQSNEINFNITVPTDYTFTRQTRTRFTGTAKLTILGTGRVVFR